MTCHELLNEDDGSTTGIRLHNWTIKVTKGSILNSQEMEKLIKDLGNPIPEMVFGQSKVTLYYNESPIMNYSAIDALKLIDHSPEKILKVAYSDEWKEQRKSQQNQMKTVVKPYDWTFTTDYSGTFDHFKAKPTEDQIDIDMLKRPDPILYYNELILYEDELADNGMATLSLRMRVMPNCFLILLRFFLRVDGLIFRIKDHRLYHEFGRHDVLLESTCSEATYQDVKKHLPFGGLSVDDLHHASSKKGSSEDLRLLADTNWVASTISNSKLLKSTDFTSTTRKIILT